MGGRALRQRPSNLPAELTSFVGRRQELREVKRLLATTRLLTMTGSGGAGKTRLAVRAAAEMARGFPDGVWLVSLAPVQDPLLVSEAVFRALGAQDQSAGWSVSALADYLAGKRLLLVLDNCEHLLDACAVLAGTLLTNCPDLRLLATSRQALGVAGEVRLPVPPMPVPAGEAVPVEQVLGSEAVWLFSERAVAVVPGFAVDADNAGPVLQLCQRLDGIPLALELAAVRLGALSLDQLNHGLRSELSVLGSANRGAEVRHQTLEATIGWSYRLLDEAERALWARLSVFAGGFDADAATEVCSGPPVPPPATGCWTSFASSAGSGCARWANRPASRNGTCSGSAGWHAPWPHSTGTRPSCSAGWTPNGTTCGRPSTFASNSRHTPIPPARWPCT